MSLRKVLLASAAIAVLSFGGSVFAGEMHADHGAPEGFGQENAHNMNTQAMNNTADARPMADWGYAGATGPARWASLDERYAMCAQGQMQSPINISQFMQQDLPKLKVAYAESPLMVVNSGNTIHVDYEPGSKFMSAEKIYDLKTIHFHTPSEHYIDGAPYPMEMHLVHASPDGELAIVAVMMKVGMQNSHIQNIWEHIPAENQKSSPENSTLKASDLLPRDGTYYTYTGSLTEPPCTEGVKWHILQQPVEISQEQLSAFQTLFSMNARPIQQMHGRVVKGS